MLSGGLGFILLALSHPGAQALNHCLLFAQFKPFAGHHLGFPTPAPDQDDR